MKSSGAISLWELVCARIFSFSDTTDRDLVLRAFPTRRWPRAWSRGLGF